MNYRKSEKRKRKRKRKRELEALTTTLLSIIDNELPIILLYKVQYNGHVDED